MTNAIQKITTKELEQVTTQGDVLVLAHDGSVPSKVSKAFERTLSDNSSITIAILDFTQDEAALDTLSISDAGPTLLAYEDGEEIGRLFRVKPKEIYDYAGYFTGKNPQPETRTADQKPKMGGHQVAKPIHASRRNFKQVVLKSNTPVLVDYWAPWCGPCHAIAPAVERLAAEFDGKVRVAKVNIDENPRLARKYSVMSIPTMVIYQDGEEVDRIVGAVPENHLRDRVKNWA